jgi:hypothetical protein
MLRQVVTSLLKKVWSLYSVIYQKNSVLFNNTTLNEPRKTPKMIKKFFENMAFMCLRLVDSFKALRVYESFIYVSFVTAGIRF